MSSSFHFYKGGTMADKQLITKLKKWLAKENNSRAKLAYLMGYESSVTITNWIKSKKIPRRETTRLANILGGKNEPTLAN